jgi:tetratricopeptide (TPR) repeat protein
MQKRPLGWPERAEERYRRGAFRSAALAFRVSLLEAPSSRDLMVMFARALEKVNPHSPFRHYARKATLLAPGNADAWLVLARGTLHQRELIQSANAAIRHAILEPANRDGIVMLSRALFQRGEFENCLKELKRAAALAPNDKFVPMAQARCLFRLGRHGEAINAGQRAQNLGAGLSEFGFDHYRIARAANRPEIATPLLEKLAAVDAELAGKKRILDLTVTVDDLRPRRK